MKKILFFLSIFLFSVINVHAKHVEEADAQHVGEVFLSKKANIVLNDVRLTLAYKEISSVLNQEQQETVYFYVFNFGINGFVIVSGDDDVLPILGYSNEGNFDVDDIPTNTKKWLEEYKNQIRYVIYHNISATYEITEKWNELRRAKKTDFIAKAAVAPLLTTKWNQSPYYNALCPSSSVTGCVATAMAQIMKYWNYPAKGTGFHSYNHQTYGTLSANFGSTTYQWSSMPNMVNSVNNAVATLMYQVGVSVDMNYSPQVSGAYVISAQSPVQHCSEYALKTYFDYKNTLQGVQRSNYNQTQWISLLKAELDASRPILYAGFGSGGGHAFVCDGYDNNNYFHFNWGWGGAYDGYFQINALNPSGTGTGGGTGGYNTGHQAVIGIEPPSGGATQTYDLQLYSNISMPSTQIWFTNAFSLTVDIANYGTGSFSGQYGAAIFDKDYNFVDFMETKTGMTLGSNQHYTNGLTFSNAGSATFVPGTYYAAIFYKTATQDWAIIGDGNYTNLKQFEIIYEADIETNSVFTITSNGGKLIQGSSATVNVDVLNNGGATFYGKYRVSLSNPDGSFAQSIQILNENNGLPGNYHYTGGNDFTGTITVAPGTYLMEIAFQKQGSSSWYYAGSADYSNPVYVIVEAPGLSPDQYEINNIQSQSYTLPISFSGNIATKNTTGSNLHIGTDIDYYKVNLPTGYDYTISVRVHDSYNSGNGNIYTADVLFSYSTDGTNWSEAYDDIMSGNITVNNGGTVYFKVAPYFSGETGTYLLSLNLNRTTVSTTSIADITSNENKLIVYPNPAKTDITINAKEFEGTIKDVSLINIQGQEVGSYSVNESQKDIHLQLGEYSEGIYLVKIQSDKGIFTKKVLIER